MRNIADIVAARATNYGFSGGRPPNKVVDDPGAKPQAPKLELFARGFKVT
jgi:hypothetical protein